MNDPVDRHEYDAHKDACGKSFDRIIRTLDMIDGAVRGEGMGGLRSEVDVLARTVKGLCWVISLVLASIVMLAFK